MHPEFVVGMRDEAVRLGFSALGISTPSASEHMDHYRSWVREEFHGGMGYLAREDALARKGGLTLTMEGVRSVVVVAQNYHQEDPSGVPEDPSRGVVARYARGADYHHVMKNRMEELLAWIRGQASEKGLSEDLRGRVYVDTGPILERDLARRAGLGWFGKNTMLIHPKRGSYFFLGLLLLDLELPPTEPFDADRCGSCTACVEGCPTEALLGRTEAGAPLMDARRCISYLTIEYKGPIPRELRRAMGNRIFGCDISQEVCPFTRKFSVPSSEPSYAVRPELDGPSLVELAERLVSMSDEDFREAFAGTAVRRARREGLLRNVCVALGNWGADEAMPVLSRALEDPSPLVREHAAWALGSIDPESPLPPSSGRPGSEGSGSVRES